MDDANHALAANPTPPALSYRGSAPPTRPIARFARRGDSDVIAIALIDIGIAARSAHAPEGVLHWTLLVADRDWDRAVAYLASTPIRKSLLVDEADLPPARVIPMRVCPRCGSTRVESERIAFRLVCGCLSLAWLPVLVDWGWAIFASLAAGWLVILVMRDRWQCTDCRHKWPKGGD